jgi:phage shock protein A
MDGSMGENGNIDSEGLDVEALDEAQLREQLQQLRESASATDAEVKGLKDEIGALEERSKRVQQRLEALTAH